jgi:hypothetical protein
VIVSFNNVEVQFGIMTFVLNPFRFGDSRFQYYYYYFLSIEESKIIIMRRFDVYVNASTEVMARLGTATARGHSDDSIF